MKTWGLMLILLSLVAGLCIYDGINNRRVFEHMSNESHEILVLVENNSIDENTLTKTKNLSSFWTEKMDTLSISISRKDLQPISDYLQYLVSALQNNNDEDALTYAKLLNYNILGIEETTGFTIINIL